MRSVMDRAVLCDHCGRVPIAEPDGVSMLGTISVTLRLGIERTIAAYGRVVWSPAYFPLWLAQLLSSFGDTLHYIALVVLVFQLTGEGMAVAALAAVEIVPVLLLAPVAGVIIDRFNRRSVLIGADLFRAALALSLLWPQSLWHVYVVAAGLVCGSTFIHPTVQAILPSLTSDDQRLAANSVAWSTGRLVQILASAVAGGLIAWLGTGPAFGLNAASFVVSALLIARLQIPPHAGQLGRDASRGLVTLLTDARDGLRIAIADRLVSRLLVVQALASLSVGATGAMLIVLSERHLGLPPAGFAWLIGAIGVGALLGPLIPSSLARDYRSAHWLFIPYVIRGVGDILLATFTPLPIALLILLVYGLNTSAGMVVFNSVLQGGIAEDVRGRIFTLFDVTWNGMRLVSLALGGALIDVIGVQPLFWGSGALLVGAGLLGLACLSDDIVRRAAAR
jgi:MFS family permease